MTTATLAKPEIKVSEMKRQSDAIEKLHNAAEAVLEDIDSIALESEEERMRTVQTKLDARNAIKKSNQPGLSDALVGPSTQNMSPGAMQMSAKVKFHSMQAINLFRGRKGDPEKNIRPIIGLARFARQAALVWSAAAMDDPYADQVLIDIELAYQDAETLLKAKEAALKDLISGTEEFEFTVQASAQPVEINLQFYSPWGFRGALLLKQFDKIVRMALTAKHVGLFTDEDWANVVHVSARGLRHMFQVVDGWVSTGIKRDDIRKSNKVAERARTKYEELKKGYLIVDQEVVDGLYRAKLSPTNRILEKYLESVKVEKLDQNTKATAESAKPLAEESAETENENNVGVKKTLAKKSNSKK